MTLRFDCTMCGRCCHDLRLPMSVDEAIAWLARGRDVQLLCEAFVHDGNDSTPRAEYIRRRSFPADSGVLPVRIRVTIVGAFSGACPNLLADMRCGAYEDRPSVCRIYPAEIEPFTPIDPARKSCPSEAWSSEQPVFAVDNVPVATETRRLIDAARRAGVEDVVAKEAVCASLGIADASLAHEGFAVHTPTSADLGKALRQAASGPMPTRASDWRVVTNRSSTLDMLDAADANAGMASPDQAFAYHGFFPAEEVSAGRGCQGRPDPALRSDSRTGSGSC